MWNNDYYPHDFLVGKWDSLNPFPVTGTAIDQETIIRLRPQIENFFKDDLKKEFKKTNLEWNMNKDGHFWFTLYFYK